MKQRGIFALVFIMLLSFSGYFVVTRDRKTSKNIKNIKKDVEENLYYGRYYGEIAHSFQTPKNLTCEEVYPVTFSTCVFCYLILATAYSAAMIFVKPPKWVLLVLDAFVMGVIVVCAFIITVCQSLRHIIVKAQEKEQLNRT